MATICFCNSHLTNAQLEDLRNGKAVFCRCCGKMMWMQNGKLQEREPHKPNEDIQETNHDH